MAAAAARGDPSSKRTKGDLVTRSIIRRVGDSDSVHGAARVARKRARGGVSQQGVKDDVAGRKAASRARDVAGGIVRFTPRDGG
jgi:hypothetical protein